ncbi:MAG: aspartyl protease family protein [Bacteroidetes bacterium]|nr:aspartyl protease family protein [Bacteroidota bacterium]
MRNITTAMRIIYAIFFLCLLSKNAKSQLHQKEAKKLTAFNFSMLSGGTIILQAQLNDFSDTLNFVFDTGSGGISLDSSTAAHFNLVSQKSDKFVKGIAGVKPLFFLNNHTLKLKGLSVEHLDFHINNYDILSNAYGIKIDGVIGSSFLRRYIIKINYNINLIEVFEPGYVKYPKRGIVIKPNFNSLPTFNTTITDNVSSNGEIIFDTGAGLNALLTEDFIVDNNLISPKRKKFTTQAEGLGGKKTMQTTVVSKIQIGPYKFKLVPVYLFKDEFNVIGYPKNLGVIGNDILRRFNLIINYPNQEIHLKPNSHFFDDFDYSYTGLGLYQINGQIRIEDVMPNSPAAKAGVMPDDIVFAVDNNFTQNMQTYKQALQSSGNSVKLLIIRNGEPITIVLQIAHLLQD